MKKQVLILIFTLSVIAGKLVAQDCTISGPAASTTLCAGGSVILTVSADGATPPITYQWEYSEDDLSWANVADDTPAGITYSGSTSGSLTVTGDGSEASVSKYYRCVVGASDCGPTNSSNAVVTTVADPNITSQPTSPAAICAGGTSASMVIAASGGTPSLTYTWQYDNGGTWGNVADGTPAGSVYSGSGGTSFSVAGISTGGTYDYRCIVSATGDGCSSATSSTVTVTVDPVSVGGTIASDQLICYLTSPANLILSGNFGSVVKWQKSSDAGFTAPTDIAVTSTTLTSATIGILTSDTYFRAVVKSGTCTETISSSVLITVRSIPTAGISVTPSSVCQNAASPVVTFTNPNTSPVTITYNINGSGQTTLDVAASTTATLDAPTSTVGTFVYILENVFYQDLPPCSNVISGTATVTVNPLPVPTITGPLTPRITSTGNVYTTESGMGGYGTGYQWLFSGGGTKTSGGAPGNNTITMTWDDTGPQTVSVNYTNANGCTAASANVFNLDVKPLPVASGVTITGTAEVGKLLAGLYTYTDGAGYDEGTSTYKWYRDVSTVIGGATSQTYTPTSGDDGHTISFEVTPKSTSGNPNTGTPVKSSPTATVVSAGVPVASEVCIGRAGTLLTGKYKYTFAPKAEGTSTYRWLRDDDVDKVVVGSDLTYTLQAADTVCGVKITFEVTPKSQPSVKTGLPVESYPLARFTMAEDTYSESISEVTLIADPAGGVFSGPGVTNGKFAPNSVGTSGSPYTMIYSVNIVNPSVTCSQKAYQQITVTPGTTTFGTVKDPICSNDDPFWITIETIPANAVPYTYYYDYGGYGYDFGFFMNDYIWYSTNTTNAGIIAEELSNSPFDPLNPMPWKVQIDPKLLNPGYGNNILYLYYYFEGYYYLLQKPLNIEATETVTRINNLNPAYCFDAGIKNLSVDILYPAGAEALWTGTPILSDTDQPVAKLNPASGIAGQTYTITYQYSSANGCLSNILDEEVTINPLPDPEFTLNATYNIDSGAVTLIPVLPPGGTFIGNGVSANKLFPDIAGTGTNIITYTIRDANSCYNEKTKSTIIRKAQGTITGLPPVVCYRDTTYTVSVTGIPSTASILDFTNRKNTIVHIHGSPSAQYNIVAAGSGQDTLFLSYLYEGVDYAISSIVNIDSIGLVEIKNLLPGDIVCANIPPFELFTSPSGGAFSGPVTGGYLDPTKAMGQTSVSYKYTNIKTGCSVTTDVSFKITPAPVVAFIPADVCIDSKTDTTFFINNTVSADSVSSWLWEFVDPVGSKTSTFKNSGNLYNKGGFHTVSLTATTIYNCTSSKTSTIDLGEKPIADFYWLNECFSTSDSLVLRDTTFSISNIVSQSWDFFDGGPLHTAKTTQYPKKSTGYQPVRYIVNTSYPNCSDTVTKSIFIRPTITITADGYLENFEDGDGDWVKDEATINNWSFGTPDRSTINSAASGVNAWYTAFDVDNQVKESSSVISPCFDFTLTYRPMISFKIWRHFDEDANGAALQYRIGDNNSWEYIGSYRDGIEWYNSTLIKGSPGGEKIGWTTTGTKESSWVEARNDLDVLQGKKDVKFRIAYGSPGDNRPNDGFAFDDIFIGERSRNVLLEHFANASSFASSEATVMIDDITRGNDVDIINIQYHTNFPGIDSLYLENPGDVSARISFYGLTRVPYAFVDGGTNSDNIFPFNSRNLDGSLVRIDQNDVTRRSLISPAFDINLDPTSVTDGILTVTGQISALKDMDIPNLTLYIAVVEKFNNDYIGAYGEKFHNVFRKFIPDAGGINLKKTWTKGEVLPITEHSWVIQETLNNSDIEVVAFMQNSVTKEMYQAASVLKPDIIVGMEKLRNVPQLEFALFPNPAKHKLTLRFGEMLKAVTDIFIYDYSGAVVRTYKAGSGVTEFTIDDLGLKDGIYLIRISSGGVYVGYKKLIIAGS